MKRAGTDFGPWRVVDKGIGQASTGKLGSKREEVGVALTPNALPPPPTPLGWMGWRKGIVLKTLFAWGARGTKAA